MIAQEPMFKTEITGWHVLFATVAFFCIIIAVDVFMVFKAVSTFGGVETDDAYRKGLQYNRTLEEARQQSDLGWTAKTTLDDAAEQITVIMTDRDGKSIEGLDVSAVVGRPATNAEDRPLALAPAGSGTYAAPVAGLGTGAWIATVTVRQPGAEDAKAVVYQSKVRLWKAP